MYAATLTAPTAREISETRLGSSVSATEPKMESAGWTLHVLSSLCRFRHCA